MNIMPILQRALVCLLLVFSLSAHSAPVRWVTNRIDYTTNGQDVKEVLRDLAASQGITAHIAKTLSGNVSGEFHMPPQRFLETLSSTFGFVWYYDGSILHAVPPEDVKSTLIRLDNATVSDLRDALTSTGVLDPRFRIAFDRREKNIVVTGPQAYVSLVQSVAERLDEQARHRTGTIVRVYPLHHAWAMDRNVSVGGSQVSLPGVARVMSGMFHPEEGRRSVPRGNAVGDISQMAPMAPVGATSGGAPLPASGALADGSLLAGLSGAPSSGLAALAGGSPTVPPVPDSNQDLPVIRADQRTNSVLIRDTPDRMFQYAELIERLDIKPRLIEIEAQIIDIEEGALRQLGVDWRAHSSHFDYQTGMGGAQNEFNGNLAPNFGSTTLRNAGSAIAAGPVGGSLSAVVGDAGRYIMARVDALQQDNKARIEASPKVATLDNLEARMDNSQQFFVKVNGYTSGNLFTVTTGVSLHVLPMVVQDTDKLQVKLDVVIQDGRISGDLVDGLPVVDSTNISTSAFVNEGQSLLIAGYKVNEQREGVTRVPFLSDIPLIGALFRHKSDRSGQRERLFLLTPRVINL